MSWALDLHATRRALRDGQVSAVEVAEAALARAEALQPSIGAFAALTPDIALAQARAADRDLRAGRDRGPLHGLPLAVKDVIDVAGAPTRMGTARAGHRLPEVDATVVAAASRAGAVVVGKATTHELAFGFVTPATRNPIDPTRMAGGSSGGSAAAVAAGIVGLALGTDTNGSVRCPAALCGVVGLKPTLGALPRTGVAPLAWTQDTVGAMATAVGECAALHSALAARPLPPPAPERTAGMRVGVDRSSWSSEASADVARACLEALRGLDGAGVELVDVSLPDQELARAASLVAILAEAAAAWGATLEADPEGVGPEVRAGVRAGSEVSAGAYLRAARVRGLLRARLRALFADARLDAVAGPTLPVTAAPAGARRIALGEREVAVDGAYSRFTALASLTGQPALSVPCGVDAAGLPIGLQLVGRPGSEHVLLSLAAVVEGLAGGRAVAAVRERRVVELGETTKGGADGERGALRHADRVP